jgi:hypothetical protein
MRKTLIILTFLLLALTSFSQRRTSIPWLKSEDITNTRYFIWRGDTIDFSAFVDSVYVNWADTLTFLATKYYMDSLGVMQKDSTIGYITLKQLSDSLATLPGGHDPVTVSTTGQNNGLTVSGQELTIQAASSSQAGALTSGNYNILMNKLSSVSHDNLMTGTGTSASPLKIDTTKIALKDWVSLNFLTRTYLDYDSLTNTPTIPVISNDAYDYATWNADVTNGASRSAIANVIQSLGGSGTNLTYSAYPDSGYVNSDTGTDAKIPLAGVNAGLMSAADKANLDLVDDSLAVHRTEINTLKNEAETDPKGVDTLTVEGTITKTVTITRNDGTTVSTEFTDQQGMGGSGDASLYNTTPSGAINGVNTVYTLPYKITSERVFINGMRVFSTDDYTISLDTIHFNYALPTGVNLKVDYIPGTISTETASVTTNTATSITDTTAVAGADVTGGHPILERGVLWGSSSLPTFDDSIITHAVADTGSFTVTLTGLIAGNTYYYRGYAINEADTTYGADAWVTTSITGEANTLKNGLIAAWELDETTGTTVYDSHTGGYDGSVYDGDVTINQTGIIDKAYAFDPYTTSPEVRVSYNVALTPDTFTWSVWVKPDTVGTRGIMVMPGGNAYTHGIGFLTSSSGAFSVAYGDGAGNDYSFNFGSYSKGIWYLIGVEWDGDDLTAYLNGDSVYTEVDAAFSYHLTTPQNYAFKVGPGALTRYDGLVDQITVHNRPLTDEEWESMYNSGLGTPYDDFDAISITPGSTGGGGDDDTADSSSTDDDGSPLTFSTAGYTGDVYYVSSSGDDGNTGLSPSLPWKTITKINSTSFSPGDAVLFRADEEFRGTITASSSGTSGNPITYGAYGNGVRPKIKGSEIVTGWTLHSGSIYKATVTSDVTQVFLDDVKMKAARFPNSGYIFTDAGSTGYTTVVSDELYSGWDYSGARIFIRTSTYNASNHGISSSTGTTLTLDSNTDNTLTSGRGFFLTNMLEFLDQAGEWYYDTSTNILYLRTPNSDSPAGYTVEASTISNGFYADGEDYLTIKDLNFKYQKDNGILLENKCDNIVIDNNRVLWQDGYGIRGSNSSTVNQSQNVSITDNYVRGQNGRGVSYVASNSSFEDNTVKDIAVFDSLGIYGTFERNHGEGVLFTGLWDGSAGGGNTIRYNTIENVGYAGIYFSGHNTTVQYNYIDKALQLKGDNGGIYCSWYGRASSNGVQGSVISYNIVRRSEGTAYGYVTASNRRFGYGIYIDENAEDVVVEHNVIEDVSDGGIFTHETQDVMVRYNLVFGGREGLLLGGSYGTTDNTYHNNTVVIYDGVDEDSYYTNELLAYITGGNYDLHNNSYYNALESITGTDVFKYTSGQQTFAQWVASSGTGEANSTYTPITLSVGETQRLIYNKTKAAITYTITGTNVRDLEGDPVSEVILQPFTGQIIIGGNLTVTEE